MKKHLTFSAFNSNYVESESKGDKDKILPIIEEYSNMTKPFLIDIINDHKAQGEWNFHSGNAVISYKSQVECKIQLTMVINFISSKESDEIRTVRTKSNNIEIMMGNEAGEIIENLFESLLQEACQEGLEETMRGSEFVCDSVDLLHYELHEMSLDRGGSYTYSPEWLKKKETIIPKNNDDKCFKYALTFALNYE